MTFADLVHGDTIYVDANTLIYHFTSHPKYGAACTALLERIEQKEIHGFTSAHSLADVAHRLTTIEAMGRLSWPANGLAARLKKHHAEIAKLTLFQSAVVRVGQLGIQVVPVSDSFVQSATAICQKFELLTGDALVVAVMHQFGLSKLASEDADFDRVSGIIRYAAV